VGNLRGSLPPPTGVATSYDVVLFGSFFEKRYPLAAGSRTTSYIQADHVDRPALTTCSSNALGWGTCSYFTWDIAASLAAVSVFTITGRWHQEMRRESYTETRQHRSFFFLTLGTAIHRANTLDYGGSLLFQVRNIHRHTHHFPFILFCSMSFIKTEDVVSGKHGMCITYVVGMLWCP